MEAHGFLSGKCKHGSSNLCTLCDIEGHPERYTELLLKEVVQEVIEADRVPLAFDLATKLMIWLDAINPAISIEAQANDAYERTKEYLSLVSQAVGRQGVDMFVDLFKWECPNCGNVDEDIDLQETHCSGCGLVVFVSDGDAVSQEWFIDPRPTPRAVGLSEGE